jgi:hypothetical protein
VAPPAFRETQRLMGHGLGLAITFAAALAVALGAYGVGVGSLRRVDFVMLAGLAAAAGFVFPRLRLDVELREAELTIVLVPLTRRTIALREIVSVQARERRPLREAAMGYEVKWGRRAYMMRSRTLVEITLRDGLRILVGTERSQELAEAIDYRRRSLSR